LLRDSIDREAIDTPDAINLKKQHLELNLERLRRQVAHEVKLVSLRHFWLLGEVWRKEENRTQIDAAAAQS